MLVLSRKKGESIIIGDDIEIVIQSIEGDTVRVGIKAPRSVQIIRKELYEATQESNQAASASNIDIKQLKFIVQKPEE